MSIKKNNNEIWKDIEGYEGYYQVSNLGNVRSLDRVILNKGVFWWKSIFTRENFDAKNK